MLATKRRHAEQLDREEDGERNVGTGQRPGAIIRERAVNAPVALC